MDEVHFVDTTIRDGHQSLWAERMGTGMMLPIAKNLDDAGFLAIELLSGSHIKKAVRELREDPWERMRIMSRAITRRIRTGSVAASRVIFLVPTVRPVISDGRMSQAHAS